MFSRHPKAVTKLVAFAANAYVAQGDVDMVEKVLDVSKWSDRMREPMEKMYGKVQVSLFI